jgi:hypothetical protein
VHRAEALVDPDQLEKGFTHGVSSCSGRPHGVRPA